MCQDLGVIDIQESRHKKGLPAKDNEVAGLSHFTGVHLGLNIPLRDRSEIQNVLQKWPSRLSHS
jgi:hypothetical protein